MLGKQGGHHVLNGDAAEETIMRVEQQFLEQGLRLLATHLPDGSGGGRAVSQWRREAGEMQERVRHAHQTPMLCNGFGVAHAVRVQAQVPLAVLVKGLNGMITNDKFCMTRACVLPLSWWRCPKSLRQ